MTLGNLLNFPQFHHIEKAHGVLWKLNGEQVIRVQKCKVSDSNYSVHITDDHDDNFFFKWKEREELCSEISDSWSFWSRKYIVDKGAIVLDDLRNNEHTKAEGQLSSDSSELPGQRRILRQTEAACVQIKTGS